MPISFKFINIEEQEYPFFELSSNGATKPTIHFTGAKGFPAAVYESFLKQFTDNYIVTAADCRGALKVRNTPPKPFGFSGFADDLIAIIEASHSKPVIGHGAFFWSSYQLNCGK